MARLRHAFLSGEVNAGSGAGSAFSRPVAVRWLSHLLTMAGVRGGCDVACHAFIEPEERQL